MQIVLKNLIPAPLAEVLNPNSEVWNKTLQLEKGKNYLIYSPSGKGKSTFLHIIYGLRKDFQGNLQIAQQDSQHLSLENWANIRQNHFSIVFQDLRLFLHLTAWENLLIKAALYTHTQEKELQKQAEFLGVAHVLHKKVHTLSYGERQRIAIIRALIQPFEWLLLDEPFSHLDSNNIQKACELINQKVQEQKASILMTSLGIEQTYFLNFDEKKLLG
ncbi:MAG: ATP-binding cassette domain-containing protein [Raineya sp.]|nr:ATP-binding cassette domain-containing protein [Raineya sp.]MDW8297394.1 ATP-binding cassette domain-containing protein [Raineya sp.]